MPGGELQADHGAVGVADEGAQLVDVQRIEQGGDGVGLVGGVDRRIQVAIGADVIEGQDAVAGRIQRAPGGDQGIGPARLGEGGAGRGVAMGGNAAGQEHHRRIGRPLQFVAQDQGAHAGVAHRQCQRDLAAQGGRHAGDRRVGGSAGWRELRVRGGVGEAHGEGSVGKTAIEPSRGSRSPCVGTERTIFRQTAQVPAGFGTTHTLARVLAAPASKGLSLRRSRWPVQVATGRDACQSFHPDGKMGFPSRQRPAHG